MLLIVEYLHQVPTQQMIMKRVNIVYMPEPNLPDANSCHDLYLSTPFIILLSIIFKQFFLIDKILIVHC